MCAPPCLACPSTQVLSVIDINEAPVVFDQSYALDVATPIRVSLVAFDPDSSFKPQFSKLNFSVITTNDTNGYFFLDPATGVFTGPPLNLDLDATKNAFFFQVTKLKHGGEAPVKVCSRLPSAASHNCVLVYRLL